MKELDPSLKAAIDEYFGKKGSNGSFIAGDKYSAAERIKDHCNRLRHYCEIYRDFDLICISLGKEGSLWFDRHNYKTGTFISADEKNGWRKMDKGRAVKSYEGLAQRHDEWRKQNAATKKG